MNKPSAFGPACMAALSIVCVLASVAAFVFRNDIYEYGLNPRMPFQTAPRPAIPDYGQRSAWALLPEETETPLGDGRPDVFLVHDTTFTSSKAWNGGIVGAEKKAVDALAHSAEMRGFDTGGRLFMPRYRQATLYTFRTRSQDSRRARTLAYQDIRRAFRHYMDHHMGNRPLVLAGVGQGGLHVTGLLQDDVAGTPLARRLVAAYVLAHPVPLDLFEGPLAETPPCLDPGSTGCVVSWTAYPERRLARMVTDRSMVWDRQGLSVVGARPVLCTNPLTGRSDDTPATRDHHLGALADPFAAPTPQAGLKNALTGARCEDGILRVASGASGLIARPPLPRRPFHSLTTGLVYGNLRADLAHRSAAFLSNRAGAPSS